MREAALGPAAPVISGGRVLPLVVRGLVYAARGTPLIRGIDLTLGAGGITVVMGPNGAGKSLLLRLLHGLILPDRGIIEWGGASMTPALRRRQAMVFQRPVLLRRSVAANVDFALGARGRRAEGRRDALLAHVGLAARAWQPARRLSGGEAQRLALARALATDPEILFLDEPTANLDPAATLKIEEVVRAADAGGTKVIFVTHDVGQARRLAADVVFLNGGRVAEHATAPRFFDDPRAPAARDFLAGRLVVNRTVETEA